MLPIYRLLGIYMPDYEQVTVTLKYYLNQNTTYVVLMAVGISRCLALSIKTILNHN